MKEEDTESETGSDEDYFSRRDCVPSAADNNKEAPDPTDLLLKDPWSSETRKERRNLLFASAAAILLVEANFIPKSIPVLNIEIEKLEKRVLFIALGVIVTYFWAAFGTRVLPELLLWRRAVNRSSTAHDSVPLRRTSTSFAALALGLWVCVWLPIVAAVLALLILEAGFP